MTQHGMEKRVLYPFFLSLCILLVWEYEIHSSHRDSMALVYRHIFRPGNYRKLKKFNPYTKSLPSQFTVAYLKSSCHIIQEFLR